MSTSLIKPDSTQLQHYDAAQDWALMRDQAQTLMKSGFLPSSIKSPEAAMAIILTGRELSIPMMTALNNIQVIQGKVTVPPQMMLALINRTGECEEIKITDDGKAAHCTMKRKGRAAHTESFSSEDADRFMTSEGYGDNKRTIPLSQKHNWKSQPRTMRKWRAVAACARVVFPDVITGLYTAEEMGADVGFSEDGEAYAVEPVREEKPVKPLALVPPAKEPEQFELDHERMDAEIYAAYQAACRPQSFNDWKNQNSYGAKPLHWKQEQLDILREESRQKVEAKVAIADPLPDTPNTTHDDEEAKRIEQEHSDLNTWIKAAWQQAGGTLEEFETFAREKDFYSNTLGWKRNVLEKMQKKASEKGQAAKPAKEKKSPKSNEPASGFAAQREDGAVKVLRKNESGELEAQWEKPVEAEPAPEKKSKLKAVVDEVIAEHFPNTPDGYNEGYKAARAFVVSIIGEFKNFDEINKADEAKAIAALSRWNPADEGRGKK